MKDLQKTAKDATEKIRGGSSTGNGAGSLARRVIVPVGAALTSAAVSYAVKKVPALVEQRLLPKLREQGNPRELARDVTQRAREAVEQHTPLGGSDASANGQRTSRRLSAAERERERSERAERRQQRKKSRSR